MIPCRQDCLACLPRWPTGIQICAELIGADEVLNAQAKNGSAATDCCTLQRGHPGPHYRCQRKPICRVSP